MLSHSLPTFPSILRSNTCGMTHMCSDVNNFLTYTEGTEGVIHRVGRHIPSGVLSWSVEHI